MKILGQLETDSVCFNLFEFPLTLKTKTEPKTILGAKKKNETPIFYLSINDNRWLMMQFIFLNSNSQKKDLWWKNQSSGILIQNKDKQEDIEWPWLEFKFQFTLFCFFFPLKLIEKSKVKIGKKRRELRSFFVVCTEIWDCE